MHPLGSESKSKIAISTAVDIFVTQYFFIDGQILLLSLPVRLVYPQEVIAFSVNL